MKLGLFETAKYITDISLVALLAVSLSALILPSHFVSSEGKCYQW